MILIFIPKIKGDIYMVLGYLPRDFGLGLGNKLSPNNLAKINLVRLNKRYVSSDNANVVNGSDVKADIKYDPTLWVFHAGGVRDEEYWNTSHKTEGGSKMMKYCIL